MREENLSKEVNIAEETHKSEEERGEDNNKNTEEENKSVAELKDAEIVHEEAMEGESERPSQEDNKIEVK